MLTSYLDETITEQKITRAAWKGTSLQYHTEQLRLANLRFNRAIRYPNYKDIDEITELLKGVGIPAIKYKHSLTEKIRDNECVLCTIKLSDNGKKLLIYNKNEIVPIDFE